MTLLRRSVAVGAAAALGAAVAVAPAPALAASTAPPQITVTLTEGAMKTSGATTLPTGPVRFKLRSVDDDHAMSVIRLKKGYTLAKLVADSEAYSDDPRAAAAANLRRLAAKVDFLGGVDLGIDDSATMTLTLKPGRYYISDQTDDGSRFRRVTITSRKGKSVAVKPTATVTMTERHQFTGDTTLPKKGSIKIANAAQTPGRLYIATFQRVKPGTTVDDIKALAGPDADPSIFLEGAFGTDLLSPGRSEILTYSMPAGSYAVQCIIPSDTGMPHAFTGMVRIVTLK